MRATVIQGNFLPARIFQRRPDLAQAITPSRIGITSLPGKPLPPPLQAGLSQALGYDFSDVRVHVGPQAEAVGALAFTMGTDIYFAPGQYQPDTARGLQILGHELVHVIQQRSGRVRPPTGTSGIAVVIDQTLESEADRLGHQAATSVQMKTVRPPSATHRPSTGALAIQPLRAFNVAGAMGIVAATENQLVDWVATKLPDADKTNIRRCVQFFMAHDGKLKGGGTKLKVEGRSVFHDSAGIYGNKDGCTLFFTVSPGVNTQKGDVNYHGMIVAIGRHSSNTDYKIHWKDPSWPY